MPDLNSRRGFTLLEMMIAVTIAVILMTTIYGVFSSNSRARMKVEESSRQVHQARVFFDRLSRELRGANWSLNRPEAVFICAKEDNRFKEIVFTTSMDASAGTAGDDGTTVRYVLEKISEGGETPSSEDRQTLYRSISRNEGAGADSSGSKYTILTGLVGLDLRFFRNGVWSETWNAVEGKNLPQLVEVTLEIQAGEQIWPFSTMIDIPMASNP